MRKESTAISALRSAVGGARTPEEQIQLLRLLYDKVTELPTVPLFFGQIREALRERNVLGFLSISIVPKDPMGQVFSWEAFDAFIRDLGKFLLEIKPVTFRKNDLISEVMVSGNAFVILLSPPRDRFMIKYEEMDKIRERIQGRLKTFLRARLPKALADCLDFCLGCAILKADATSPRLERLVYQALDGAFADSLLQQKREADREAKQLWHLLRGKRIQSVFQPVVDLVGRRVLGYEALSRSNLPGFERPDHVFRIAYEQKAVWALERICREKALTNFGALARDQVLFLNIEAESIYDPELQGQTTHELITRCGLKPGRIVLELTEHAAVKDFSLFRAALQKLQLEGFRLAIDDVGSAYSGLQSIAELKPDFMKIDMSLTHGVSENELKRELLSTIYKFAKKMGIGVIAEGIEEKQDLEVVRSIGIPFAQGYLLARPRAELPPVDLEGLLGKDPAKT